ncbi:MAG: hypothetical protein EOO02_07455, partial [Chitinophagaceae bacterium]
MIIRKIRQAAILPVALVLLASGFSAKAQNAPYKPKHDEMLARYKAAALRDSAVKNTIYKASITPHWSPDESGFWYTN